MHALYDHKVAIKTRFKPNGENFFIWQNLKFEKKVVQCTCTDIRIRRIARV